MAVVFFHILFVGIENFGDIGRSNPAKKNDVLLYSLHHGRHVMSDGLGHTHVIEVSTSDSHTNSAGYSGLNNGGSA
jgi:hypothetical protein